MYAGNWGGSLLDRSQTRDVRAKPRVSRDVLFAWWLQKSKADVDGMIA